MKMGSINSLILSNSLLFWQCQFTDTGVSPAMKKQYVEIVEKLVAFQYLKWVIRKMETDFVLSPVVMRQGVMVLNWIGVNLDWT